MNPKPDYFTMNPAKFLADKHHDAMSPAALGAYFRLLCRQWIDGELPEDPEELRRLARVSARSWPSIWVLLEPCLPTLPEGARGNQWMTNQRQFVSKKIQKSISSGKEGAERRWGKPEDKGESRDKKLDTPVSKIRQPTLSREVNKEVNAPHPPTPFPPPPAAGAALPLEGSEKIPPVKQDPIQRTQLEKVVEGWNTMAKAAGLPCASLTDRREKCLRVRLREKGFLEAWAAALRWIPTQRWMLGQTERAWKVDLDWLLQPGKVQQMAEKAAAPPGRPQGRQAQLSAEDEAWLNGGARA